MPIYNFGFTDATASSSPRALTILGPVLQVHAEVPTALASQLRAQAAPIPGPVEGFALIDTGGGLSALHESAVQRLQLQPTEVIQVATAAGQHQRGVYSGRLIFPGTNLPAMDFSRM